MAKKLFMTGTGTDVGKTYVTGLLVKKLCQYGKNVAYYKAAMSGNERDDEGVLMAGDALKVKAMSGVLQPVEQMCPYVYENAVSPHLAARIENNPVQMNVVKEGFAQVCEQYAYAVMEGSGGIVCPIRHDGTTILLEDIVKELELPCLIVADAGLGTINAVVLTVEYMQNRKIPVKGIILNHWHPNNVMEEDNLKMCEEMTGIKVIACVKDGDEELEIDIETLERTFS